MIKVTRLNAVTSWSRALNAARRTEESQHYK